MTTPNLPISQWSVISVPDPNMSFLLLNPKDNITPPAGSGGSNQRVLFSNILGAMIWPSGDPTGVKDTANIIAAIAQVPASGGTVTLVPTAQWYINCGQITINRSGVYINAQGCFINAIGAGDMIRMYDSSAYTTRSVHGGGILGMPTIDGSKTAGPSSPFHGGDILQLACYVKVQRFEESGSKGVWFDNQYFWTEQLYGRVYSKSVAGPHVVFDNSANASGQATGSFDRMKLDCYLENNGLGDGVVFQNGAILADGDLGIYGNFSSSSVAQYAVLRLTGANGGVSSNITNSGLNIGVELGDTTNIVPQSIAFGAGGNVIFSCSGHIDFSASHTFASSNSVGQFWFLGPVNGDTNLGPSMPSGSPIGQTITGSNQTIFTHFASFNRCNSQATNWIGMILASGNYTGQRITVMNIGTGSLTFAATATSHVADGAADVIAAGTAATYVWDEIGSLWYRS